MVWLGEDAWVIATTNAGLLRSAQNDGGKEVRMTVADETFRALEV